jgi:hypothetical protein
MNGNSKKCGNFSIIGTINIFRDEHNEEQVFEVIEEQFMYKGFAKSGAIMSQSDWDIYMEYFLPNETLFCDVPMEGIYGVIWDFDVEVTQDYYGEYDIEIKTYRLDFKKIN